MSTASSAQLYQLALLRCFLGKVKQSGDAIAWNVERKIQARIKHLHQGRSSSRFLANKRVWNTAEQNFQSYHAPIVVDLGCFDEGFF